MRRVPFSSKPLPEPARAGDGSFCGVNVFQLPSDNFISHWMDISDLGQLERSRVNDPTAVTNSFQHLFPLQNIPTLWWHGMYGILVSYWKEEWKCWDSFSAGWRGTAQVAMKVAYIVSLDKGTWWIGSSSVSEEMLKAPVLCRIPRPCVCLHTG